MADNPPEFDQDKLNNAVPFDAKALSILHSSDIPNLTADVDEIRTLAEKLTSEQIETISGLARAQGWAGDQMAPREALAAAGQVWQQGAEVAQALGLLPQEYVKNLQGAVGGKIAEIQTAFEASSETEVDFDAYLKQHYGITDINIALSVTGTVATLDAVGVYDSIGLKQAILNTPSIDPAAQTVMQWPKQDPEVTAAVQRVEAGLEKLLDAMGGLKDAPEFSKPGAVDGHLDAATWQTAQEVITSLRQKILGEENPEGALDAALVSKLQTDLPQEIDSKIMMLTPLSVFDEGMAGQLGVAKLAKEMAPDLLNDLAFLSEKDALKPVEMVAVQVPVADSPVVAQTETPELSIGQKIMDALIPPAAASDRSSIPVTQQKELQEKIIEPPKQTEASAGVTANPASVQYLEQKLTKLGLMDEKAVDGKIGTEDVSAIGRLRDIVIAIGGGDPVQGPVTKDNVGDIAKGIQAFTAHENYKLLEGVRNGQLPEETMAKIPEEYRDGVENALKTPDRAKGMEAILSLKALYANEAGATAEDKEFSEMWKGLPPEMKANMPAVMDTLTDSKFTQNLEQVYAGATPLTAQQQADAEKLRQENAQADLVQGGLKESIEIVQTAAGMFGDVLDDMAGKLPLGLTKESIGFNVPQADGTWDATTQDATAKMVMGLKMAAFGFEENADGVYTPEIGEKLRKAIYTSDAGMAPMLREKFNIEKMDADEYRANAKAFAESSKAGKAPDDNNKLDTLIFSLDMIYENDPSRLNNGLAASTNRNNMALDFVYDNFMSKNPQLMAMLQGFFEGNQFGQLFGTLLGMKGIQISRLWGDTSSDMTDLAAHKDNIVDQYKKALADVGGDHEKLAQNADEALNSMPMQVVKKIFSGQLADMDASLKTALAAGKDAAANGADASEAFANSLIADAEKFRQEGAALKANPEALNNPGQTLPQGAQPYLENSQQASNPSAAGMVAGTGGAGDADAWAAAQSSVVAAKPFADTEVVFGKERFELSFTPDPKDYDPNPLRYAVEDTKNLQQIVAGIAEEKGLHVKTESYMPGGQATGMWTKNWSMAMEEILFRAQLENGVELEDLQKDFNKDTIQTVANYLGNQEVAVILTRMDNDSRSTDINDPQAGETQEISVLDQVFLPGQVAAELSTFIPKAEEPKPAEDNRYPGLKGVDDDNRDIFEQYKALNAGKHDPNCAPLVYEDENGEVFTAVVIEKTNEFKILALPDFKDTRDVPLDVQNAYRDNYNWRNPGEDTFRSYIERHLCLDPLVAEAKVEQKPAEEPEPAAAVAAQAPAAARVAETYRDLPEFKGNYAVNGNYINLKTLDHLYLRSENDVFGKTPDGRFMVTEINEVDQARMGGADAIVSIREGGEINHYLLDYEKHGVMPPPSLSQRTDADIGDQIDNLIRQPGEGRNGLDDFLNTPYARAFKSGGIALVMSTEEMDTRGLPNYVNSVTNPDDEIFKFYQPLPALMAFGPYEHPVNEFGQVKMRGEAGGNVMQDWQRFTHAYLHGDGRPNGFFQRNMEVGARNATNMVTEQIDAMERRGVDPKIATDSARYAYTNGQNGYYGGRFRKTGGGSENTDTFNDKAGCEDFSIPQGYFSWLKAIPNGFRAQFSTREQRNQWAEEFNQGRRDMNCHPDPLRENLDTRNEWQRKIQEATSPDWDDNEDGNASPSGKSNNHMDPSWFGG